MKLWRNSYRKPDTKDTSALDNPHRAEILVVEEEAEKEQGA
jgi:hypothetical protein